MNNAHFNHADCICESCCDLLTISTWVTHGANPRSADINHVNRNLVSYNKHVCVRVCVRVCVTEGHRK